MRCDKKGCKETEIQEHHILPKCMRKDELNIEDGERKTLCKKHHDVLQLMLINQVWKFVSKNKKEECKEHIKTFTEWWLNKY